MLTQDQRTQRIRELNDNLRKHGVGGRIVATRSLALDQERLGQVIAAVRAVDYVRPGDDPYDEHDFVPVEIEGQRYYAKIDYYDTDMAFASEDPADPDKTVRVMTLMRADDY